MTPFETMFWSLVIAGAGTVVCLLAITAYSQFNINI